MEIDDLDLALALRRIADASEPPPIDPRREAALMAAVGAAQAAPRAARGADAGVEGDPGAATILIAVGLVPARAGRHGSSPPPTIRGVQNDLQPPSEFVMVPGAAALPRMESGSLVRMDVPLAMLPSLGLTPPAGSVTTVKADVIVGQDGLTRAVRLVN